MATKKQNGGLRKVLPEVEKINHPPHYNKGAIEVIDFIEDQAFTFHLGNAVKYICRSNHKDNFKGDIEKAIWYLQRVLGENKK